MKARRILHVAMAIGLLLVIAGAALVTTIRSSRLHRYILANMSAEASQASGGRVEIGDFNFQWPSLRVDFYRIVLHGSESASAPPLFQADHLLVALKIISIWRRKVEVRRILIDRPAIHISVQANGNTNLPQVPPSPPGSPPAKIFNLAIGSLVVNQGELDYNDEHIPLAGEVHGLHTQVAFDPTKTEYDGELGYQDGRVRFGTFSPLEHELQFRFAATPAGLQLNAVRLKTPSSSLAMDAHIWDYRNPSVEGSYQAEISTRELADILKVAALPAGEVYVEGDVHYQPHPNSSLFESIELAGEVRSPALGFTTPQARAEVHGLTGQYRLSNGTLEARNIEATVLGGSVTGHLTVNGIPARPGARFAANVRGASLEALSRSLAAGPLDAAGVSGTVNANLAGFWNSTQSVNLRADATIAGVVPNRQEPGASPGMIPLRGDLHLAYDGHTGMLSATHSELTAPHLSLAFDGTTGKQSSLNIALQSDDLREVDQIVLIARRAMKTGNVPPPIPLEPMGIAGRGSFNGQLHGPFSALFIAGRFHGDNVKYQGVTLTRMQGDVALSASNLALTHGEVRTGDGGEVQFDVSAGVKNWTYTPQTPVQLSAHAQTVAVATLQQLADLHYPVTGTLTADISLQGSQSSAAGRGDLKLAQATAWGQPVKTLGIHFEGAGTSVRSTLQLSTAAGSASGELNYNFRNKEYVAKFSLSEVQLDRWPPLQSKNISGTASATIQGKGTLNDPRLAADIQSQRLVVEHQNLDGFKLHAELAQQQAQFTIHSETEGASVQAQGKVKLTASYPADATLDVRNVQLGSVLASFLPHLPPNVTGHAELHGTVHGPLKDWRQLEVHADIPTLNLEYRSLQIGNALPLHAEYRGGAVTIEPCEFRGTGTDVKLQASAPLQPSGRLRATATGNVDLHLMQMLDPDWDISGRLELVADAEGTLPKPEINATVRLVDAAYQASNAPLGAQKVNVTLSVKNGRVDIQSFEGETGGGSFVAQGFAIFQPSVQFNVTLAAKKVRLRYPLGTRTVFDGDLALTGSPDSALLSGKVLVDRLSLTREFDLSTFADQFVGNSSASVSSQLAQNTKLDISVATAAEMALASSKLNVQGSANLVVRGTAADPVILGRSDITSGEVFFNGNRFQIENGLIQFVNPTQTEPVVNIMVTTTVQQFNLSMNFVGPIDRLRTTYTSDPPLAPIDIINLLATGQTTEAPSTSSTSPESVIAGQLTGQLSSRVEKLAGITSLTIDPQVGGQAGNGGGRLAVQQRVTKNLFFTFSTDLTTSTGSIVQIEYQVSKRFAVSTIRDQNGGYTLQVKLHKKF